jgi:hypothetical protein
MAPDYRPEINTPRIVSSISAAEERRSSIPSRRLNALTYRLATALPCRGQQTKSFRIGGVDA